MKTGIGYPIYLSHRGINPDIVQKAIKSFFSFSSQRATRLISPGAYLLEYHLNNIMITKRKYFKFKPEAKHHKMRGNKK